jgi:SM-20-related protein
MPNADFFTRFGLFVDKEFLDPETCARLRSDVQSATSIPATVRDRGATYTVDESVRRTKWADVSAETRSFVEDRVLTLKPTLERHFDLELTGCQPLQFLVYRKCDFFQAHVDSVREPDAAEFSRERRVAVVLFLNSESEEPGPDSYGGGSLTFYGLLPDPRAKSYGFPLIGEAGVLVAFLPEVVHEVTPVTHGERYTVVTWFV